MMSASQKHLMVAPLHSAPRTGTMTLPNTLPINSDQEGMTSSNKKEKNPSPFDKNDDMGEEASKKTVPIMNDEDALNTNKHKRKRHYKRLRKMKHKSDRHRHQKRHSGRHKMHKKSKKVSRNHTRKRFVKMNNSTKQSLTLNANIHLSNTQAPEDVQVNQSVAISPSKSTLHCDEPENSPNFQRKHGTFEKFSRKIFKSEATPAIEQNENEPPFFLNTSANSLPNVTRIWLPEKSEVTNSIPIATQVPNVTRTVSGFRQRNTFEGAP